MSAEPSYQPESEDLFAFDEIWSPPPEDSSESVAPEPAPAMDTSALDETLEALAFLDEPLDEPESEPEPAASTAPAASAASSDESEDLFDFDQIIAASSPVRPADDVDLEELVAALPALGDDDLDEELDEQPERASEPQASVTPAARAAAPAAASAAAVASSDAAGEEPVHTVVGKGRLSPTALLVLSGVTVLNLALVGVTWRTGSRLEETFEEVGRTVVRTTEDIRDETHERSLQLESLVQPIVANEPGEPRTFELVQADLERGDYAMARRRLHALLAVADRYDADLRADLEARASFLLADTLVVQASALAEEQL